MFCNHGELRQGVSEQDRVRTPLAIKIPGRFQDHIYKNPGSARARKTQTI